jgi:hypothetical protein
LLSSSSSIEASSKILKVRVEKDKCLWKGCEFKNPVLPDITAARKSIRKNRIFDNLKNFTFIASTVLEFIYLIKFKLF